jgi:hypothetical protein
VESERAKARRVLLHARSGELSVEDFHAGWPDSADPLIGAIFEETEDTVEHVPGPLLKRGTDQGRFRQSAAYKTLIVDEQLLLDDFADVSSERLVEIRDRLLKDIDWRQDDETLAKAAREFVAREVGGRAP